MNEETPTCRNCRRKLDVRDTCKGEVVFIPGTGIKAPENHYGGYVCSYNCDYNATLSHEGSMPGHGASQREPSCYALERIEYNWR